MPDVSVTDADRQRAMNLGIRKIEETLDLPGGGWPLRHWVKEAQKRAQRTDLDPQLYWLLCFIEEHFLR